MASEPTSFQKILLESYPDIDLLPIDPAEPRTVIDAIADDSIGDTLFRFIWNELDADCTDLGTALQRLQSAIDDIAAVRDALSLKS